MDNNESKRFCNLTSGIVILIDCRVVGAQVLLHYALNMLDYEFKLLFDLPLVGPHTTSNQFVIIVRQFMK